MTENIGRPRLINDTQIQEIRRMYEAGQATQDELAVKFNISQSRVNQLLEATGIRPIDERIASVQSAAPALEVQQAALIKRMEARIDALTAERDALQGEIAELLDYAERGGGAYEQDGFAGYSEKGRQVFELLKLLREESMASAFLNDELNRLEATLKKIKECRTITAIDELVAKALGER